ncbi:NUDIX domain-containing protein [Corynebacterium poyangense]|uniref:NUDIX domain-containing protein n=1 Tax=Corynebacterium poyangense TaxID=2684405 RepID=A0A7H0SNQ1_9CORY|nr:NUDIX hydrolase [Corynebacterium poyangense]MBZ8177722.1 NUDIX domain-containing protein [Corynebacterium poyangense]QNQ90176.1 NUDIX domain-containing protein [Corynebacterium poyangense]
MAAAAQHKFQAHESEVLVDAPILALRRDQVEMPGGKKSAREIVEHFGAVAVVAYRPGDAQDPGSGEIALVRQYRQCVAQRLLELPAGILDLAQEEELHCAQRELQEEAGLAAKDWRVLVDLVTSPGFCDEAVRVYLAQELEDVPQPEAEDEEADMVVEWVPLSTAVSSIMRGEIVNSIAIAGIFAAAEVVSGRSVARPVSTPFALRPQRLAQRRIAQGIGPDLKKL